MTVVMLFFFPVIAAGLADAQEDTTWTVMVYMAADGDPSLPWQDDINEMESAEGSAHLNTIVLVDPDGYGNSMLLEITHDPATTGDVIVSPEIDDGGAVIDGGEVNTGSPATLQKFIEFVALEYPADNLVLVLWGHGGGWLGLCPDGLDLLTLPELESALDSSAQTLRRNLDLVAVDACAEGVVETMYEIRQHVDWFVASERGVPLAGLPYGQILDRLAARPEMTVPELGTVIADEYVDWAWFYSSFSVSMAVFDLRAMERFVTSLSELASQGLAFGRLFSDQFHEAYLSSETYEMEQYIDIGDFVVELLRREIPLEMRKLAKDVLFSYAGFVDYLRVYSHPDPVDGITMPDATGSVVFFPSDSLVGYAVLALSETMWDEFAAVVSDGSPSEPSAPGPELSYRDSDDDGTVDEAVLAWTGAYTSVSAWVFRVGPDGLVYEYSVNGTPNTVTVRDVVGSFVVAASAFIGSECASYDTLDVSLAGTLEVWAEVRHLGEQVGPGYSLELVTSSGSHSFEAVGSWFLCMLEVPASAEVGDTLLVLVREGSSGDVVGSAWVVLEGRGAVVKVEVLESEDDRISWLLLIPALLPAAAILLVAVLVARRSRQS